MPEMLFVIVLLSYLFLLSEIMLIIFKRSKKKSVKLKRDRGSLLILWISIAFSLTIGFSLAKYETWSIINYLIASFGILIFIIGSIIRWQAIIQLKKAFTVNVVINQEHQLRTDGLYRLSRHPSYLGLLLIMSGLSIGMNSLLSFIIVTIPFSAALLYRISVEERILKEEFGATYTDYIKKTKKIIPYIY
jgi:protein-S-isoprenylcysteine O-methyltransferase Ste14